LQDGLAETSLAFHQQPSPIGAGDVFLPTFALAPGFDSAIESGRGEDEEHD
jgi:hypothetical protein